MKDILERAKLKLIRSGLFGPTAPRGAKVVLAYHGIDLAENQEFNPRFFSATSFEAHLKYYRKNYQVITLEEYFESKNLSKDRLNVAITFDDGYRNNLTYALPLLEKFEVSATFFVTGLNTTTDRILWADLIDIATTSIDGTLHFEGESFNRDRTGRFSSLKQYLRTNQIPGTPRFADLKQVLLERSEFSLSDSKLFDYWKLLSDQELKELDSSPFASIGSHGMTHNNLGNLPHDVATTELKESKSYLENLLQREVCSIGYPDGSYTPEIVESARQAGYRYQCAVDYKFKEDSATPDLTSRLGLYPVSTTSFINYQICQFHENSVL